MGTESTEKDKKEKHDDKNTTTNEARHVQINIMQKSDCLDEYKLDEARNSFW